MIGCCTNIVFKIMGFSAIIGRRDSWINSGRHGRYCCKSFCYEVCCENGIFKLNYLAKGRICRARSCLRKLTWRFRGCLGGKSVSPKSRQNLYRRKCEKKKKTKKNRRLRTNHYLSTCFKEPAKTQKRGRRDGRTKDHRAQKELGRKKYLGWIRISAFICNFTFHKIPIKLSYVMKKSK